MSAFGDSAVVSVFDATTGEYYLALLRGRGELERLPIASSPAPFDADLGPDSDGRPAVVYSRCADARSRPTGACDLAVHTIGVPGERPIRAANSPRASDYEPSLWRGEVAWLRSSASGRQVAYSRRLTAPQTRPSTRQPGMPTRNCGVAGDRGDCITRQRALLDLELYGDRLAVSGSYVVANQGGFRTNELRLLHRRAGSNRRAALFISGEGGQTLPGLSFSGGRLGWYRSCFGDPGGCGGRGAFRYRYTRGTYEAEFRYRSLTGFALLDDGALAVDGQGELGEASEGDTGPPCDDAITRQVEPGCPVLRLGQLDWRPIAARRVR